MRLSIASILALTACIGARSPSATAPATPAIAASSHVIGTVTNRDGTPVPNVTLTLHFQEIEQKPRKPVRTKSNKEGKFSLGPVTSGLYCVHATSIGYQSAAREFTLDRGETETVNIALDNRSTKVRVQKCLPDRASIDMCPVDKSAVRESEGTRCAGQA